MNACRCEARMSTIEDFEESIRKSVKIEDELEA
jgi:hypothetical protein